MAILPDGETSQEFSTTQAMFYSYFDTVDGGLNWAGPTTLNFPTESLPYFCNYSFGVDGNGRLHAIGAKREILTSTTSTWMGIQSCYSDDFGANWSTPTSVTMADTTNGQTINHISYCNGVMLANYYNYDAVTPVYKHGCFRCAIPAANPPVWAYVEIENSGTNYINESDVVALDSTHLLGISRTEYGSYELMQYLSTDNGATTGNWTNQGRVNFFATDLTYNCGPPLLRSFQMEGQTVIACYYLEKLAGKIYVRYALPSALISSGVSAWTALTLLIDDTYALHYGDVLHLNDNFNAIGLFCREIQNWPWDFNRQTRQWMNFQSTHYATIKTALGI
jgi:hypothetical protein